MKYAIRGNLPPEKQVFSSYPLWKPPIAKGNLFEVFVNAEEDKTSLFEYLKTQVTEAGEWINWHECTRDENIPKPCMIQEDYRK